MVVLQAPGFSPTLCRWVWWHCASRSSIRVPRLPGRSQVPGPVAGKREMRDLSWLGDLLWCRGWKRRTAGREGGGGSRPGERAEEVVGLSGGTGSVPATPRLFWAQVNNDRLWREARAHLERRKWTSRDSILLCPQGSQASIGKQQGAEMCDSWVREWECVCIQGGVSVFKYR